MTIQVAQLRIVPEKGNLQQNHDKLMAVLSDPAVRLADVVVTSECFLDGYVASEDRVNSRNIADFAIDPSNSPFVTGISAWARDNSAWVFLGCSRLCPEGVFNTVLIFNRTGELAGWYDKTHCQTTDKKYLPGQAISVFPSDFGPFGVLICADRRWPEAVRTLALQGARIIFNPTYGMHDDKNRHMMQTRSFESELFIAFTHPLQSLLTGPAGQVICDDTNQDAAFIVTEIDLSEADTARADDSAHLRDRRPELYAR